jgi:hypothetical protein
MDTGSSCLLLVAQRDTGLAGWTARCLNRRATSEFWSDQVVSLNPPADLFHCGSQRERSGLIFCNYCRQIKKVNKYSNKCWFVRQRNASFTRCLGHGKPGIISFSLGTGNFVVWWDFSFLFVLMHLIRQLAETMSVCGGKYISAHLYFMRQYCFRPWVFLRIRSVQVNYDI